MSLPMQMFIPMQVSIEPDLLLPPIHITVMKAMLYGALYGATIGGFQWLLLRQHIRPIVLWTLWTALGNIIVWILAEVAPYAGAWELSDGLWYTIGAVTGCLQWLILRKHIRSSGLWVLVSAVGWAVGLVIAHAVAPWDSDYHVYYFEILLNTVYGATTGGALVWLLRNRRRQKQ